MSRLVTPLCPTASTRGALAAAPWLRSTPQVKAAPLLGRQCRHQRQRLRRRRHRLLLFPQTAAQPRTLGPIARPRILTTAAHLQTTTKATSASMPTRTAASGAIVAGTMPMSSAQRRRAVIIPRSWCDDAAVFCLRRGAHEELLRQREVPRWCA